MNTNEEIEKFAEENIKKFSDLFTEIVSNQSVDEDIKLRMFMSVAQSIISTIVFRYGIEFEDIVDTIEEHFEEHSHKINEIINGDLN